MDSVVLPHGLRCFRKWIGQFLLLQAQLTPSVYDIFTRVPAASLYSLGISPVPNCEGPGPPASALQWVPKVANGTLRGMISS